MSSHAAQALRCGKRAITTGDKKIDVIAFCGEPDTVQSKTEHETWVYGQYSLVQTTPIQIETWIYNFGSRRLMVELFFRDDVLKKIDTLGYGY